MVKDIIDLIGIVCAVVGPLAYAIYWSREATNAHEAAKRSFEQAPSPLRPDC